MGNNSNKNNKFNKKIKIKYNKIIIIMKKKKRKKMKNNG